MTMPARPRRWPLARWPWRPARRRPCRPETSRLATAAGACARTPGHHLHGGRHRHRRRRRGRAAAARDPALRAGRHGPRAPTARWSSSTGTTTASARWAPTATLRIVAGVGELAPDVDDDDVGARLNHPTDVTFDPQGRLVIAAWHNSRVKRVDLHTLALEDIAGTGARSYSGDDGPALRLRAQPAGQRAVYDPAGNLFISDQANQRIRRIDPGGTITHHRRLAAGAASPATAARPWRRSSPCRSGQRGHPAGHIALAADGDALPRRHREQPHPAHRPRRHGLHGRRPRHLRVERRRRPGAARPSWPTRSTWRCRPRGCSTSPTPRTTACARWKAASSRTVVGVCGKCGPSLDDPCRCPATDAACIGDGGPAGRGPPQATHRHRLRRRRQPLRRRHPQPPHPGGVSLSARRTMRGLAAWPSCWRPLAWPVTPRRRRRQPGPSLLPADYAARFVTGARLPPQRRPRLWPAS